MMLRPFSLRVRFRRTSRTLAWVVGGGLLVAAVLAPMARYGSTFYRDAWHALVVGPRKRPLRKVKFEPTPERRQRGEYLVEGLLACFRCHSDRDWNLPGAPAGEARKGAGHVFHEDGRPWLVAPNITSDAETGAGLWTDDMIARAIREGIGHDGDLLHPQMWYPSFRDLSDEDVASIVVYLRTVPAVRNRLPETALPLDRRLEYWNLPQPITAPVPSPDLSDPVKRGEYLAGLADCAGCHTSWYHPGAPLFEKLFAGGNLLTGAAGFHIVSPNITLDPSGISYYDERLFMEVMRTGRVKARPLNAVMPWAWYGKMTDEDLKAIFAYLRSQPAVRHGVDNTEPPTYCRLCMEKHGGGDRN